ncbi:MAG: PorP/SprF family type IX secretion system membrane protein [Crocinitomicaceae bacterium]|nr:PorP/SprF family type IX secretion system membrane protein [Crocinitomicaceae bacterium]
MIKKLVVVVLLGLAFNTQAQQIPMYNEFHIAPRVYNPSYVGFQDGVDVVLVRNQKWGNYDEGFITNYLSASYLLKGKHGLGINLYNDYVGITSKLKAHLLYSYTIKLGDKAFLRAGAGLGVVDNRVDFNQAIVSNPSDPVLSNVGKDRRTMFDMNVGINFEASGFRIGVSVPQVLGTKLVYGDMAGSYYTLERQYLLNTGYTWRISDSTGGGMSLRPEALVMYAVNAPFQYNAGLFFEMDKYFWIGGMYKSDYAIGINLGINLIKNLKIGLAYDYQITPIASLNTSPNAELLLKYTIPPKIQKIQDDGLMDSLMMANQRKLDSLKKVIDKKDGDIEERDVTIKVLEDSLSKWPKEQAVVVKDTVKEDTGVRTNSGDYFIELNGEDTPDGYYVIGGAFAEKKNADALLRKIKSKFPSARIIKNKRNDLYYVMLYYSTKKGEGLAYATYKANQLPDEETWILYYQKPPDK